MHALRPTPRFERALRRVVRAHPSLHERLARVLRDLAADPQMPQLRLHPLHGRLTGLHAVSITHDLRLVVLLRLTEGEIDLINIGSHDDVYRA